MLFNRFFRSFSYASAWFVLIILFAILLVLFHYSRDAIHNFGFFHFITNTKWIVGNDGNGGNFGGLIPILGTIYSSLIAMFFAIPIAMGIAIFLTQIAPEFLKGPVGVAIELLAVIPSTIYGMWGLFYFGPLLQSWIGGQSNSLLTAGLVLGIMVIPFMASLSRDAMNTTPSVLVESAYSMGATRFEVIKDVIFPYSKKGIIGSVILSLGRALGETMAVAFLIGGVFRFPHSLTQATISIPVLIANNFGEAGNLQLSSMFYMALILFIISFFTITLAKFYFLRKDNE